MEDGASEDLRLVASVLHGDQEAFAGLVRRHQSLVAGVAWRYGTRRDDVEDVVSEVFLKVYRNLGQYRPDHPFATWLYRLTANHVMDRARRARKERHRSEMPEQVADPGPGAGEAMETDERAELLRAALTEVDPRFRDVIVLVHVEGLKVEEAARILSVPEGTVKTRLMRGREALKKILVRRNPEHFVARTP
jgi:RNA polymerase sigma-70 factor (ECF subfamily)